MSLDKQADILRKLWTHFGNIAALPHCPGGEDPVREYIYNFASKLSDVKIKWYQKNAVNPGQRVIVLQKNPSQKSRFILQGHMDMVCTPPDMKFPLHLVDKDGWRSALDDNGHKCTLGADNGIGTAAALALLESDFDGGFECFFTVEEETTMGGAGAFDPGLLDARTLLNLDSEEVDTITYGCAGGIETNFNLPLAKESIPQGVKHLELKVSGLRGGHSAICINMGRLNAIKILTQCLKQLHSRYEFNFTALKGGNAKNAIPIEAIFRIIIPEQKIAAFLRDFDELNNKLAEKHKINEPNLSHSVTEIPDLPDRMLDAEFTKKALEILSWLPHGVIKMDQSFVMTSNNLGVVETSSDYLKIRCFHRSALQEEIDRVSLALETIGNFYCAEIKHANSFPSWAPREDSPVLKLVKEVYSMGGVEPNVEITHGGLECSFIYQKYNGAMDCVSIGPELLDPHSVNERVNIQSVATFLERLLQVINKL